MTPPQSTATIGTAATACIIVVSALGGCGDDDDATTTDATTTTSTSAGGNGAGGPTTTAATGGAGGTGGAPPECTTDAECTDPTQAKCDAGTCVACDASPQCEGLAATPVCATSGARAGTCVACTLTEAGSCTASQTCNLLDETCADVAAMSVDTCGACSNDAQCVADHRCVPMDFPVGTAHGFYCLELPNPACTQPYSVFLNEPSLNGEAATNYCGIDEDNATCEAVTALLEGWVCSGTDGMCSPDGVVPEEPVAGALCRQVGSIADQCTYACASAVNCLIGPPGNTCGDTPGPSGPPNWCGG
ncbi:MAG: hypothetical protein AAF715_31720 [Myxococcota bacterium]